MTKDEDVHGQKWNSERLLIGLKYFQIYHTLSVYIYFIQKIAYTLTMRFKLNMRLFAIDTI